MGLKLVGLCWQKVDILNIKCEGTSSTWTVLNVRYILVDDVLEPALYVVDIRFVTKYVLAMTQNV